MPVILLSIAMLIISIIFKLAAVFTRCPKRGREHHLKSCLIDVHSHVNAARLRKASIGKVKPGFRVPGG